MSGRIKRMAAPRRWPVKRKVNYWAAKPSAGPHSVDYSVPLIAVVRDMLSIVRTAKEGRLLISQGSFSVDGRVRKDPDYPVGLMDVLTIKGEEEAYRMLIDRRNRLHLVSVTKEESSWKLCRVQGRQTLSGGRKQIRLHDGRNILGDVEATTGDVFKIELPTQKVVEVFKLAPGSKALITGGHHVGELATVKKFEKWRNPAPNLVHFEEGFSTVWTNVFVSGKTQSAIKLPEVPAI